MRREHRPTTPKRHGSPGEASRPLQIVLAAGLTCGVLDGLAASAYAMWFGGTPAGVFRFVASGLLGRDALSGGLPMAALGLALHFVVALSASAVYYVAAQWLPVLVGRALPMGVLYGATVHVVMSQIVVPASAIGRRPFNLRAFLIMLAIHVVVVGPSIALTVRAGQRRHRGVSAPSTAR